MDVPLWLWLGVLGLILAMLAIDLIAHRDAHVITVREAAWWSAAWVALGLGFGGFLWFRYGPEIGQQYFSGFVIEKSLAVDNVFIWAIIFAAFAVPRKYQHRVLFLGVLGALIFRGIFIAAGYALISSFSWVLYIFATFLIFTGIQMLRKRNEHPDPTKYKFVKWFNKVVPTGDRFYGQKLLVRIGGVVVATPLLMVLALIEFTDIVFAIDSIPAIFAVTDEPFVVFTANAFAVLGLRAMYFLLADLIHRFIYLKHGLSVILVWVGIKMALHDFYKVPTTISLAVIILVIAVAVIASLIKTRGQTRHEVDVDSRQVYENASEEEMKELQPLFRKKKVVA
ncbi:MAG: TerC family protein [Actinomycetota bacterium]